MVGHHLEMILPASLSIENKDLVKVKSRLSEIVNFNSASNGYMRVVDPQVDGVQYARRQIVVNIL